MRKAFLFIVLTSACSDTEQLGVTGVCVATPNDDPEDLGFVEVNLTRSGLTAVAKADETEPPEHFSECAAGMPEQVELVTDDGDRIWLAAVARYGARELLPPGVLGLANDSDLRVEIRGGGFSPISQTLFLSRGEQPLVALQNNGTLAGETFGILGVENAGGNALPSLEPCGSVTTVSIRFIDDDSSESAANGESKELIVGGVEFTGANVYSIERGTSNCEDGPREGLNATWVAFDNSL